MNKLLIFFIVTLLVSTAATASKLDITDIIAWVDGDKDSMSGGSVDNVKPGSVLKIKVEFTNDYTDEEDNDLEDIEVIATLKDIEDEGSDDIEFDDEIDKIRTEDSETVTFTFNIPLEIDEDSYDLVIEAEGEDQNNTKHSVTETYRVDVEKETHELRFYKADLSTNKICSGLVSLSVGVMNTGTDTEDVVLTVINNELSLNKEAKFELDENPYDSDSKMVSLFDILIPDGTNPKTYPITVQATYSSRKITNVTNLVVECDTVKPVIPKSEPVKAEPVTTTTTVSTPTTTVNKPVDTTSTVASTTDSTLPETQYVKSTTQAKTTSSSSSESGFVVLFVLLEIIIVAALVFGIIYYKKHN